MPPSFIFIAATFLLINFIILTAQGHENAIKRAVAQLTEQIEDHPENYHYANFNAFLRHMAGKVLEIVKNALPEDHHRNAKILQDDLLHKNYNPRFLFEDLFIQVEAKNILKKNSIALEKLETEYKEAIRLDAKASIRRKFHDRGGNFVHLSDGFNEGEFNKLFEEVLSKDLEVRPLMKTVQYHLPAIVVDHVKGGEERGGMETSGASGGGGGGGNGIGSGGRGSGGEGGGSGGEEGGGSGGGEGSGRVGEEGKGGEEGRGSGGERGRREEEGGGSGGRGVEGGREGRGGSEAGRGGGGGSGRGGGGGRGRVIGGPRGGSARGIRGGGIRSSKGVLEIIEAEEKEKVGKNHGTEVEKKEEKAEEGKGPVSSDDWMEPPGAEGWQKPQ